MREGPGSRIWIITSRLLPAALALAACGQEADPAPAATGHSARWALLSAARDAGRRAEHAALLELLPDDEHATHVAAQDGPWFSEATWEGGAVPAEGAIVRIPESVTVTYDGASTEPVFLVRVDGALQVRAREGGRTLLVVDTLFTTPASRLSIEAEEADAGTIEIELRPFDIEEYERRGAPGWGRSAQRLYSDGAPVTDTDANTRPPRKREVRHDGAGVWGRYEWDPLQLSIALIAHGEARISGRQKQGRARVERTARKGDASILLEGEPGGWAVGDALVITGTHYVGRDLITGGYLGTEDEIRTIAGLRGAEVVLDRPLTFDHDTPRDDLKAWAANLTRNVLIHSAEDLDPEHLDADEVGALASRLGHVMFMHDENVSVHHAAFDDLGRSNKNEAYDDFQRFSYLGLNAGRIFERIDGVRHPVKTRVDQVTNPRGRYAVHVNRTGATHDDGTALVEGCVVTGGAGWGFVSADSRVDFRGNVAYGVLGAGFVSVHGNETGTWEGNIAINTFGADFNSTDLEPLEVYRYENDNFHHTILLEKRGAWKNQDFGHCGNGFWFQGKQIDVVDNVSAGSGMQGYYFMFRAPEQYNVDPELLVEPLAVHGPDGIHPFAPGLNVFTGNESIADRGGLAMIGLAGGRSCDERGTLRDFTAWEVGQIGTYSEYYPNYNIHDSTFIASSSEGANPTDGVLFYKAQLDVVLANLTVEGFPLAYNMRKSWSPGSKNQHGFDDPYEIIRKAREEGRPNPLPLGHAHVLVDLGFTAEEASQRHLMGATWREEDLIITSDQLVPGRFEIELDDASLKVDLDNEDIAYGWLADDPNRPTLIEGHVLLLRGTKTDSIGSIPIDYHNNLLAWHRDAVQQRLESEGYYRMAGGRLGVRLEEVLVDRFTGERHVVRFLAELDPRWDLGGVEDLGAFDPEQHPDVHVPRFLLEE